MNTTKEVYFNFYGLEYEVTKLRIGDYELQISCAADFVGADFKTIVD